MKKLLIISSVVIILASCSEPDKQKIKVSKEIFPKGYWIDKDKISIITFSEDGEITDIVYNSKVPASNYAFIEKTPTHFSIEAKGEGVLYFYKASEEDFFIGQWKGILSNEKSNFKFFYSDFTYCQLSIDDEESEISISSDANSISLDNTDYKYRITELKDSIYLSKMNNDIILTRGAWSEEEIKLHKYAYIKQNFVLDNLLEINSEQELKDIFGEYNVSKSRYYNIESKYDEGTKSSKLYKGTINEVELLWNNQELKKDLRCLFLSGTNSKWQTKEGITLGTEMRDIEILNDEPFRFYGFTDEYGGHLEEKDWNKGVLAKKGLYFIFRPSVINYEETEESIGGSYKSNSVYAKITSPYCSQIIMWKKNPYTQEMPDFESEEGFEEDEKEFDPEAML